MKILMLQSLVSLIVPVLLEVLKRWRAVPWVTRSTDTLNRVVAAVAGLAAVVGINAATSWDPTTGTWSLTVRGLQLDAVLLLGLQAVGQLVAQEGWYRGLIKPSTSGGPARLLSLVLVAAVAAGTVGCAGTLRDRVRTSAALAGETVLTLDQQERVLYVTGGYGTDPAVARAKHLEVGAHIDTAIVAVRAYERAARAWPADLPTMPQSLEQAQQQALAALDSIARVLDGIPPAQGVVATVAQIRARIGG